MSLRNVVKGMRAEIDEVLAIAKRGARGGEASFALQNRAFTTLQGVIPDPTAGSAILVAACKLTARASGIFLASANMAGVAMTPTDTLDMQVTTQTRAASAGITLTGATLVGPGTANAASIGSAAGGYILSAAGGIAVTGGPFGSQIQGDSNTQVLGTLNTTATWAWSCIVQNGAANVETPFPIGNDVVLLLSVNRSAATMSLSNLCLSLVELP